MLGTEKFLFSSRLNDAIQSGLPDDIRNRSTFFYPDKLTQELIDEHDVFIGFYFPEALDLRGLKWVHCLGAGVDGFLLGRLWPENVLLTRTTGIFGYKIAQYCLSYVLRELQFHDNFDRLQEKAVWKPLIPEGLADKKILIAGAGDIGCTIAGSFSIMGAEVFGISRSGTAKKPFKAIYTPSYLDRIPTPVDWVINALPATSDTLMFFDRSLFSRFAGCRFISVGRGSTVDEKALLDALDIGRTRMAILDVFEEEPLSPASPFWDHPKLHITPHIAGLTTPNEALSTFLDTLDKLRNCPEQLTNKVNPAHGY